MKSVGKFKIEGNITIKDEDGNILFETPNAIHYENMSIALATSLSNKINGPIFKMVFGNGGSSVDSLGTITYLEPNVIGSQATLYNETYEKVVDDNSPSNIDAISNNISVEHEDTKFYADIVVTATLDYGEPSGQSAFDTSTTFNESFVFDEIGLKTEDNLLLTHAIFHPYQKSLNRIIEIIYVVRISIA